MVRFQDFDRVRVFTHGRKKTPYGFTVGDSDDFALGVFASVLGAFCRLADTDPDAVRARWGHIPDDVLHIVGDFVYPYSAHNVVVFDHHSPGDPDERCSVHRLVDELVKQGLYPCTPALMSQISAWDTRGPQAVAPEARPDPDRYLAVLGAEPLPDDVGYVEWEPADAYCVLWALHAAQTVREFVDLVYNSLAPIGARARANHDLIQQHKKTLLEELAREAEVSVSPSGVRYATLRSQPAGMTNEIFARLGVDIIIHPNERTHGALSVVRDSNGRFASTPVAELVDAGNVVFAHPGGFLLVAYPPVGVK